MAKVSMKTWNNPADWKSISEIYDGHLVKTKELSAQGLSFRKIEKQMGVCEGTIRKRLCSHKSIKL